MCVVQQWQEIFLSNEMWLLWYCVLVVYDDDITDAFFSCLTYLYSEVFKTQPPLVYVALEKRCVYMCVCVCVCVCAQIYPLYTDIISCRVNFTLEHLAAVSPAHQHFMQCITRHHTTQYGSSIKFTANQIPLQNIAQCFSYDRSDHMVRMFGINL